MLCTGLNILVRTKCPHLYSKDHDSSLVRIFDWSSLVKRACKSPPKSKKKYNIYIYIYLYTHVCVCVCVCVGLVFCTCFCDVYILC